MKFFLFVAILLVIASGLFFVAHSSLTSSKSLFCAQKNLEITQPSFFATNSPAACAVDCKANKPTSTCVYGGGTGGRNPTTCVQFVGGACVYRCTSAGTWDDGAACTSGQCHTSGQSCGA